MSRGKPIAALLLCLLLGCSSVSSGSDTNNADPNHLNSNDLAASALCPAGTGGITVGTDKRFLLGMNYAWVDFGANRGGIAGWGQNGVSSRADEHAKNIATMRKSGAGFCAGG